MCQRCGQEEEAVLEITLQITTSEGLGEPGRVWLCEECLGLITASTLLGAAEAVEECAE